jgi:hypothetical protein
MTTPSLFTSWCFRFFKTCFTYVILCGLICIDPIHHKRNYQIILKMSNFLLKTSFNVNNVASICFSMELSST